MNAKIQLALWISHPVLELLLASVLIWRKLHRRFPIFLTYIVFQIADFALLFPIHQYAGYALYFYTYWIDAAITLALAFLVIHEVFLDVFRAYHTLRDLGTVLFKWAGLVMIFVAIVVAASSPPEQSPLVHAVVTGQRCVRVIQCGLVLFLLVFSRYLGVSWKQPSFGIALGLGGFASVELAGNALYSGEQIGSATWDLLNACSFSWALLIWICYALAKVAAKDASSTLLMSQRWEQSLGDLRRPVSADSLIPMFEGMVDRAFSRSSAEEVGPVLAKKIPPKPASAPSLPRSMPLPRAASHK